MKAKHYLDPLPFNFIHLYLHYSIALDMHYAQCKHPGMGLAIVLQSKAALLGTHLAETDG